MILHERAPAVIRQITWVYTHYLDSTTDFYASGLGFECWRDTGGARIFETASGACIGVCEAFDDRVVEPKGGMISLVVDDIEDCYRRLRRRSVKVDAPPERIERFGIRRFFVHDPNGYVIEFQQFD